MNHKSTFPPRYANIFQKSIRYLTIVSIFLFGCMAVIWSVRITDILENRAVSANQSAVDTIYNIVREQHEAFKRFQMDLCLFQYDRDTVMSEYVEQYLLDIRNGQSLTPLQKQDARQNVDDYLRSIGSATGNNVLMLMVTGYDFVSEDPYMVLSNVSGSEYARQTAGYIAAMPGTASRRSTILLPSFASSGSRFSVESYVIYDDFRSMSAPSISCGRIAMTFRTSALNAALNRLASAAMGNLYVINASGDIVFDSSGLRTGQAFEIFDALPTSIRIDATVDGQRIHGMRNVEFGFTVINAFSMSDFYPVILREYLYIALMTVAALLLCITLCYLFFRRYLTKTTRLLTDLSAAGEDMDRRIAVEGERDEIDSICIRINAMLDTIQQGIIRNYAQEMEKQNALLQKREAELYALQAQIDPHFLYNTLEMIRMRLVVKGETESANSIKLLGSILRSRIKGKAVRFLSSEIEQCQSLVELYNLNYGLEAILEAEIPSEYLSTAVIQDTLVPLVENILTHIKPMDDLQICITLHTQGDMMNLRVQDNGQGFSESIFARLRELFSQDPRLKSESIGLVNLHQRLRLVYGEGYGLTIANGPNGGAMIDVRIRRMGLDELDALLTASNPESD